VNDLSVGLAKPAGFAPDATSLPALLVGADYRIAGASDAARRFLAPDSTADDIMARVTPALAPVVDDLLAAVFDRAVPRVSRPVEVDLPGGRARVVVSASPHPSTPDRPLALVLFLEDGGSRPPSPNGIWELGPTTQLEGAAVPGPVRPGGEAGALIKQVSRLHSDLHNLLQAAEVTALFLDSDLRLRRYAGGLERLLAVGPADIGRPLAGLGGGPDTDLLAASAAEVMRTLQPIECEVRGRDGGCHLARLRPHVGTDAQIEGVIVTFVDVTRLKEVEARLRAAMETLDVALDATEMGWLTWDAPTNRVTMDARARLIFGFPADAGSVTLEGLLERIHPADVVRVRAELEAAQQEDRRAGIEFRVVDEDGSLRVISGNYLSVREAGGPVARWSGMFRDVTAQRTVGEALQRHARMLTLASEASGIGWGSYEPRTGLTVWDARGREIMGITGEPGDMTQEDVLARVHPDDRERIAAELAASKTAGGDFRREYRIIRPDGEVRDILGTGAYISDESGAVTHATGLLWDVTERKRQELALEERERTLRLAIQAANMAVWEWDLAQNALRVMVPIEDMAFPAADSPLENHLGFIHPDDREALWKAVEGIASGTAPLQVELRGKRSDGTYRWLRAEAELIRDDAGVPVRLLGVSLDIHAQKESELAMQRLAETLEERVAARMQELAAANAELQAAEARFHTLFEASPVPAVLLRLADGITIDVNSAFLGFGGLRREDIVGHPADELRERFGVIDSMDAIRQAVKAGQLKDYEHQYRDDNGETRTLIVSVVPIEIDGQPCLLGSSIDITARKEAERKVRELASELSLAEQRERQRLSSILHDDLQQRLYALQLQLTWLRDRAEQDGAGDYTEVIDALLESVPETVTLTRRLSVDLSPPILRGEGLPEALSWLASQMREQYGLEVVVRSDPRTRSIDEGLRIQVFQVLRELLFNVVKHAGVSRAEVILEEADDALRVTVRDEGKGFVASGMAAGTPSGRGLATNRQRLELIGCSMEIQSAPGAGTTIVITAPLPGGQRNGQGAQPS
jgi:PAS domain S-box-containing protein